MKMSLKSRSRRTSFADTTATKLQQKVKAQLMFRIMGIYFSRLLVELLVLKTRAGGIHSSVLPANSRCSMGCARRLGVIIVKNSRQLHRTVRDRCIQKYNRQILGLISQKVKQPQNLYAEALFQRHFDP